MYVLVVRRCFERRLSGGVSLHGSRPIVTFVPSILRTLCPRQLWVYDFLVQLDFGRAPPVALVCTFYHRSNCFFVR